MTDRICLMVLGCLFILGKIAPEAQAALIPSVHSTGAGGSSGSTDTNWSIVGPGGSLSTFVTSTSGFPIGTGAWVTDNLPSYGWVSPQAVYTVTPPTKDAVGSYTFSTTFDLTGFNPASAVLQFQFAVDNSLTSVKLNSTTFTITGSNLTSLSAVQTINSGFIAGLNTITFNVTNAVGKASNANPVGLLVDFTSATADPAGSPEPATFGIVGFALVGLGALKARQSTRNRRSSSSSTR
jgi:hypothetical protein